MIPKEILKQIKRIQIRTNRLVNDVFAGQYGSIFKGRGMEFNEVREYQPGDEVRTIDWNVTARFGRPFVKKFTEERELTIMLLVDMSGSERFGSFEKTKEEVAAEISSLIAFSAIKNNDRVGMIIFTDRIEKYIPPAKTTTHILRIIREILFFKPEGSGTDISGALEYFFRVQKKRAIVFLISDFIDSGYIHSLRVAAGKHDVVAVSVSDRREFSLPCGTFFEFFDLESSRQVVADARSEVSTILFNEKIKEQERERKQMFERAGVDYVPCSADGSYIEPLLKFFYLRARRFR
ncbi:MAG: DUF58 domain-containing protein [Elusimicrobiota bacterium]